MTKRPIWGGRRVCFIFPPYTPRMPAGTFGGAQGGGYNGRSLCSRFDYAQRGGERFKGETEVVFGWGIGYIIRVIMCNNMMKRLKDVREGFRHAHAKGAKQ